MHYIGRLASGDARTDQLNTLDNLWLETHASHRQATSKPLQTSLVNAQWMRFEDEIFERVAGKRAAAGSLQEWGDVGRKVVKWYFAGSKHSADEPALLLEAQRSLPKPLQDDAEADWTYWPAY